MAAIKGSNTKPEMMVRRALHKDGLRYRLHSKELPGKPDLVFPKHSAAVFIHGCFWHRHDCHLFKWPSTRQEFWADKIGRNVKNDDLVVQRLRDQGWRVATVWECALKGRTRLDHTIAMQTLVSWIKSEESILTIRGK